MVFCIRHLCGDNVNRDIRTMLCFKQYCKIINLFTVKMIDLWSKKKLQIVSQTSDLLTNVFDIGLAQGIKQY